MKKFIILKHEKNQKESAASPPLPSEPPSDPTPTQQVKKEVCTATDNSQQEVEVTSEPNKYQEACRDFLRGVCKRGGACKFVHRLTVDKDTLMQMYTFCHDFENSHCKHANCKYLHATISEKMEFYRIGFLPPHVLAERNLPQLTPLLPPPQPPPPPPPPLLLPPTPPPVQSVLTPPQPLPPPVQPVLPPSPILQPILPPPTLLLVRPVLPPPPPPPVQPVLRPPTPSPLQPVLSPPPPPVQPLPPPPPPPPPPPQPVLPSPPPPPPPVQALLPPPPPPPPQPTVQPQVPPPAPNEYSSRKRARVDMTSFGAGASDRTREQYEALVTQFNLYEKILIELVRKEEISSRRITQLEAIVQQRPQASHSVNGLYDPHIPPPPVPAPRHDSVPALQANKPENGKCT